MLGVTKRLLKMMFRSCCWRLALLKVTFRSCCWRLASLEVSAVHVDDREMADDSQRQLETAKVGICSLLVERSKSVAAQMTSKGNWRQSKVGKRLAVGERSKSIAAQTISKGNRRQTNIGVLSSFVEKSKSIAMNRGRISKKVEKVIQKCKEGKKERKRERLELFMLLQPAARSRTSIARLLQSWPVNEQGHHTQGLRKEMEARNNIHGDDAIICPPHWTTGETYPRATTAERLLQLASIPILRCDLLLGFCRK